jgi:hypothetical protein
MTEDSPTQSGDLGPMPEPEIEPGEVNPGGADAMPEDDANGPRRRQESRTRTPPRARTRWTALLGSTARASPAPSFRRDRVPTST